MATSICSMSSQSFGGRTSPCRRPDAREPGSGSLLAEGNSADAAAHLLVDRVVGEEEVDRIVTPPEPHCPVALERLASSAIGLNAQGGERVADPGRDRRNEDIDCRCRSLRGARRSRRGRARRRSRAGPCVDSSSWITITFSGRLGCSSIPPVGFASRHLLLSLVESSRGKRNGLPRRPAEASASASSSRSNSARPRSFGVAAIQRATALAASLAGEALGVLAIPPLEHFEHDLAQVGSRPIPLASSAISSLAACSIGSCTTGVPAA